jgi:hypothetical protein
MDVPQVVAFSNVFELLKAMSLTPRICFELKSLDYKAITIEFVNCFPTKSNGDILFELPLVHHPLGHFRQLQNMDIKYDLVMFGASYKLVTSRICLDWALE